MLRLEIISDVHLELHADNGRKFFKQISTPESVDVLILAGDITCLFDLGKNLDIYGRFAKLYRKIVVVPGNHEFWNTDIYRAGYIIQTINQAFPNIKYLYPHGSVDLGSGKTLHGATGWFPRHKKKLDPDRYVNDFHKIPDLAPWCFNSYNKFKRYLNKNLKPGDIVVTHYLPSEKSIPESYRGWLGNRYYVGDHEKTIEQLKPSIWIHGHTHFGCTYKLHKTRVLCNPYGYPDDRAISGRFSRMFVEI